MGLWLRRSVIVAKCRLYEMSLPRIVEMSIRRMHLDEMSCTHMNAIKEEQKCLLNRDGNMILEISENVRFINLCIYTFSNRDEKQIEQCILDFFPFSFFLCSLANLK